MYPLSPRTAKLRVPAEREWIMGIVADGRSGAKRMLPNRKRLCYCKQWPRTKQDHQAEGGSLMSSRTTCSPIFSSSSSSLPMRHSSLNCRRSSRLSRARSGSRGAMCSILYVDVAVSADARTTCLVACTCQTSNRPFRHPIPCSTATIRLPLRLERAHSTLHCPTRVHRPSQSITLPHSL